MPHSSPRTLRRNGPCSRWCNDVSEQVVQSPQEGQALNTRFIDGSPCVAVVVPAFRVRHILSVIRVGDEDSSMKTRGAGALFVSHVRNFAKRIFYHYYLRDLATASMEHYDIAAVPRRNLHLAMRAVAQRLQGHV